MAKLSLTMESYLDAIYELSDDNGGARLKDIAERRGVTKSTANAAMNALAEMRLVQNERYQHIRLTETGVAAARDITKKHEIVRRFFAEILKIDAATAEADACAIEHVISSQAIDAMRSYLQRWAVPPP
jgi:Mn-dependent DtxR family transcriptional regulator